LLSLQVGALWRLSWWDYHAFLLTGFDAAVYAVLTGYRRSRALHEVLDGVFAADPMAHISRGYSETLRALIGAVEARDAYTHGHSARVAELSVHLGQRLGLRPAALRTLAEGAYLHDVGKVGIPDHVLNKPGALSDEERAWIEQHPVVGADIVGRPRRCATPWRSSASTTSASTATATPTAWPGEEILPGGPHRRRGRRVGRAHPRPRLPGRLAPDRALRHLEAGRGTHFDPVCLDAFLTLMTERGHRPGPGTGDPAEASAAAQACHDEPQAALVTAPPRSG
jgi:HD-GYP domain-containing protein (c-di-GMP phosphodiesterase class II)